MLTATFDGNLGSDDPFHDAELESLNDMAELRHLYSAIFLFHFFFWIVQRQLINLSENRIWSCSKGRSAFIFYSKDKESTVVVGRSRAYSILRSSRTN